MSESFCSQQRVFLDLNPLSSVEIWLLGASFLNEWLVVVNNSLHDWFLQYLEFLLHNRSQNRIQILPVLPYQELFGSPYYRGESSRRGALRRFYALSSRFMTFFSVLITTFFITEKYFLTYKNAKNACLEQEITINAQNLQANTIDINQCLKVLSRIRNINQYLKLLSENRRYLSMLKSFKQNKSIQAMTKTFKQKLEMKSNAKNFQKKIEINK